MESTLTSTISCRYRTECGMPIPSSHRRPPAASLALDCLEGLGQLPFLLPGLAYLTSFRPSSCRIPYPNSRGTIRRSTSLVVRTQTKSGVPQITARQDHAFQSHEVIVAMVSSAKAEPASVARTMAKSHFAITTFLLISGLPLRRNRAWTLIPLAFGLTALANMLDLPRTSFIPSRVSKTPTPFLTANQCRTTRQRERKTSPKGSRYTRTMDQENEFCDGDDQAF